MQKALHNLKAVDYNIKGDFGDWAVSAAFYAMYHSLLAILFKLGYDSRNQECTINATDYFIKTSKIKLDTKYIAMIRRTDELMGSDAKALREEFQYGTETEVEDEILESMQNNANEFVESARVILEEIKS
ncbi:MAG: HEPN domain-containing protein [Candidatus Omnitrophota bacterium]|nr:HEPN domain-containing protein [Candidatus Omnitrophota bacterium]